MVGKSQDVRGELKTLFFIFILINLKYFKVLASSKMHKLFDYSKVENGHSPLKLHKVDRYSLPVQDQLHQTRPENDSGVDSLFHSRI